MAAQQLPCPAAPSDAVAGVTCRRRRLFAQEPLPGSRSPGCHCCAATTAARARSRARAPAQPAAIRLKLLGAGRTAAACSTGCDRRLVHCTTLNSTFCGPAATPCRHEARGAAGRSGAAASACTVDTIAQFEHHGLASLLESPPLPLALTALQGRPRAGPQAHHPDRSYLRHPAAAPASGASCRRRRNRCRCPSSVVVRSPPCWPEPLQHAQSSPTPLNGQHGQPGSGRSAAAAAPGDAAGGGGRLGAPTSGSHHLPARPGRRCGASQEGWRRQAK